MYMLKWEIRQGRRTEMPERTIKAKMPMEHLNIAEFNRGQSSKLIHSLVKEDKAAFIQKNGKPIAVVISNERYQRLLQNGIDINDY